MRGLSLSSSSQHINNKCFSITTWLLKKVGFYSQRKSDFFSYIKVDIPVGGGFTLFFHSRKNEFKRIIATMDSTDAPQIIEHINKSITFTPYDTRWVPFSARFVAMGIHPNAKGALNVYQLNNGDLDLITEGKTANGIKCGTFAASSVEQRHIATGDHAGKLIVYDLEHIDKPVFSQQAHVSIINAIDGCGGMDIGYGAPEIVTGGRDGCVRLWDVRVKDPVLALEPDEGQPARDCWTVAFGNSYSDDERCIVAGYDNGDVKVFDLRANTMRYETNVSNGVTSIEFDRKDIEMNKMVVSILIPLCIFIRIGAHSVCGGDR